MTRAASLRGQRIAVLGPGAVGSALAGALHARGAEVRLWGRTPGAAARVRRRLAGGRNAPRLAATSRLERALAAADVVLVCVGDDGLDAVAERVGAALAGADPAPVVLHTNGFRGPDALAPAADAGAACGVLHPLAPVVAASGGGDARARPAGLAGVWFAVAGARRARAAARRLVRALGGRALELSGGADAQAAYHAAASLASGGLVALFDAALGPFARAAADPAHARAALSDLMARTLGNLQDRGAGDALTGAAARGSARLVAAHLDALRAAGEGEDEIYALLVRRMVALARSASRLDAQAASRVLAILERDRRGSSGFPIEE
jgi:predicted short-subunit dehydrogenase-like oxidoreductase (DUF2520 family)